MSAGLIRGTGVVFVNLGDKRSGSGGHNNSALTQGNVERECSGCGERTARMKCHNGCGVSMRMPPREGVTATRRNAPDRYNQAAFGRTKSKMLLPHRFAIGCEDGLADPEGIGWIVRQDQVWQKLNGLPESVTDRTRDSHEYWFCLTKNERYYSATDEIREPHNDLSWLGRDHGNTRNGDRKDGGKPASSANAPQKRQWAKGQHRRRSPIPGGEWGNLGIPATERPATITGYACACPSPTAPTTPAVILDPFVGTGTVPMVARALGRYGVGIDLSADYLRLARWRTFESGHAAKAIARTHREAQGSML